MYCIRSVLQPLYARCIRNARKSNGKLINSWCICIASKHKLFKNNYLAGIIVINWKYRIFAFISKLFALYAKVDMLWKQKVLLYFKFGLFHHSGIDVLMHYFIVRFKVKFPYDILFFWVILNNTSILNSIRNEIKNKLNKKKRFFHILEYNFIALTLLYNFLSKNLFFFYFILFFFTIWIVR